MFDADRGLIVTNSHVVIESRTLSVESFEGETGTATRVGCNENMVPDVALLETDMDGLTELPVGDRSDLVSGDPLLTIGRHETYDAGRDWLLSTVPTSQGNSSGPLLTVDGDVVGVVSGTTTENDSTDVSRSDELYTELPVSEELATSTPTETLLESIDGWT